MPTAFDLRDLHRQLVRFRVPIVAALTAFAVIASLWTAIESSLRIEQRSSEDSTRAITRTLARLFEDQVARIIRHADMTLIDMRADLQVKGAAFDIGEWMRATRSNADMIMHMAVADANGRVIHASSGAHGIGVDLSDRAHFRTLRDLMFDHLVISEPIVSRVTDRLSVQVMRRTYRDDGTFGGFVQISLDPRALSSFYGSTEFAAKGSVALLRQDGIRLARGPENPDLLARRASPGVSLEKVVAHPSETFVVHEEGTADGERISAYRAVAGFPLVVRVSVSDQATFGELTGAAWTYRSAGIAATLLVIVTALLIASLMGSAERVRRQTDQILQEAIDAMPDGFVIYDKDDRLRLFNKAYKQLYAVSAPAIERGRSFEELLRYGLARGQYPEAGDTPKEQEAWLARRLAAHHAADGREIIQDLGDRWLRVSEARTSSGLIVGVRVDMSGVKSLEADLASTTETVRKLARVTELTPNEVMVTGLDRRITWANPAFCNAFDLTLDQVVGRYPADVLRSPPDSIPMAMEARARALQGENVRFEQPRTAPDGSIRWASVVMSQLQDDAGVVTGVVTVATDITDRKRHEQVIESYSKDLERFAHVASHDLQEPLRKIATHARLLAAAVDDQDRIEVERCIGILLSSAQRGRNIVTDLLRYAKLKDQPVQRRTADLARVVADICEQLEDPAGPAKTVIHAALPPIPATFDVGLITQVVQNVVGNAVKYRKKGQPATITIEAVHDAAGEVLRLHVRDDGIGFDMAYKDEIFQPFKRLVTRNEYQGTGIGLSLVRSILDKHGWDCDIEGTPGVGTTFTILVPYRDLAPAEVLSPAA